MLESPSTIISAQSAEPFSAKELALSPRVVNFSKSENLSISFSVNSISNITVKIYNTRGILVGQPYKDYQVNIGNNTLTWNGKDFKGKAVPDGLYICYIEVGGGDSGIKRKVFSVSNY